MVRLSQKYHRGRAGEVQWTAARQDWWRLDYYTFPYLAGARVDVISQRFRDVFLNLCDMNENGQIAPHFEMDKNGSLISNFTHLLEEWGSRGGIPVNLLGQARKPILKYFENGNPIGVQLFAKYKSPPKPFIVKYSKKQFLEPLLRYGNIRICLASYYGASLHLDAIRDDETYRHFFIPTFRERMQGKTSFGFKGREVVFGEEDLVVTIQSQDYYLYSLCNDIYYSLPSDFEADAALIIRDPIRFSQHLVSAFLSRFPNFQTSIGNVTYFDPYKDYDRLTTPEMSKHFSYSYQREYRVVLRSPQHISSNLEPEYLTIGSMNEYAELISI